MILSSSIEIEAVKDSLAGDKKTIASLISLLKRKGVDMRAVGNSLAILATITNPWIPGCQGILEAEPDLSYLLEYTQKGHLALQKSTYKILLGLSKGGEGCTRILGTPFLHQHGLEGSAEDKDVLAMDKEIRKNLADFEARKSLLSLFLFLPFSHGAHGFNFFVFDVGQKGKSN